MLIVTVNVRPNGPVQPVKEMAVIEPIGLVWPLPDLRVAEVLDDVQVRTVPVLVSLRVVVPAVPVTFPPGVMVQVARVVVANDGAMPRVTVRAAAAPVAVTIAPMRLSM